MLWAYSAVPAASLIFSGVCLTQMCERHKYAVARGLPLNDARD
jgi:hypothetical protein